MKKNEHKQLLVFAYGLPVICFILAWRQYAKHGLTLTVEAFIISGSIVLLMALFIPSGVKVLFKCWMKIAQAFSKVVTIFILILIFFCVIVPAGMVLRLMGKDFMKLGFKVPADTYWVKRETKKEGYTQQF